MLLFCDETNCKYFTNDLNKLKKHQYEKHVAVENTQGLVDKSLLLEHVKHMKFECTLDTFKTNSKQEFKDHIDKEHI